MTFGFFLIGFLSGDYSWLGRQVLLGIFEAGLLQQGYFSCCPTNQVNASEVTVLHVMLTHTKWNKLTRPNML